jgi:hypothetical protein
MRFLCITQNHGFSTTARSQPGLQKRRGEAPGTSAFSIIGRCTFSPSVPGRQFFLFFPRKSFLGIKITLYPKKFSKKTGHEANAGFFEKLTAPSSP